MEYPCAKKRISVETWMKKLTRVFLEKSELQLLKLNTVCAFPQCEKSKKTYSRLSIPKQISPFLIPETLALRKKAKKKGQLLTIILRKNNRSMSSTFKEDQKLPTSVTPETCIIKDTNDSADLNSKASRAVSGKKLLNWIFSFQNSFRRKILMIDRAHYVRGHMWTQKMQTLSTRKNLKSAISQLVFACYG